MRKTIYIILASMLLAVSCKEEWEPVFAFKYDNPAPQSVVDRTPNTTIAELKDIYYAAGKKVDVLDSLVIGGRVVSSDESGNLYRSLYLQDETGAIELKIAKSSLYNEYKQGQYLYVYCQDLTLGQYGGMVQLGFKDQSGKYDTAYIGGQYLIDAHIFKGKYDPSEPLVPEVITEDKYNDKSYWGRYVKVENLVYQNEIFVILYDDAKNSNSTYLRNSDNYGVTTWAMSQNGFKAYMTPNGKVEPQEAFNGAITKDMWQAYYNAATAYSVSQYFSNGKQDLQVRTSGYAKFADYQIDPEIISGAKVNMTGILTYYNGNYQFLLLDLDGVEIIK